MSRYKCCTCGSDLGLKSEIACPKCDFEVLNMDYDALERQVMEGVPGWKPPWSPIDLVAAATGEVWTTDPPKETGWYVVMFDNDERSIARITAVQNGNATWATLGPFGNCHIGVSDRDTNNPLISFWGEKIL